MNDSPSLAQLPPIQAHHDAPGGEWCSLWPTWPRVGHKMSTPAMCSGEDTAAGVRLFLAAGRSLLAPERPYKRQRSVIDKHLRPEKRQTGCFCLFTISFWRCFPSALFWKKFPHKQIISFTSPPRKCFPVSSKKHIYMKQGAV